MRHFLSFLDWTPSEIQALVERAGELKRDPGAHREALLGRMLGLVFFDSSLRTLFSSQAAMARLGGSAIPLHVGKGTWQLEHRDGVRMDGACSEHVREAVPVLGRYADILGVRCFARLEDAAEDLADPVIRAFGRHSTVPVINLESAMEHPCQALADLMTASEVLGDARGRNFTLTWAPQAKATPMAVPHSALLAAAWGGMNVRLLHPEGYDLQPRYLDAARVACQAQGSRLEISHDPGELAGSDVVYVKSWGASRLYGQDAEQAREFQDLAHWRVSEERLRGTQAPVMHCLPVRRDVVVDAAVLDGPRSKVVDQAENRMWVFMALLLTLLQGVPGATAREGVLA